MIAGQEAFESSAVSLSADFMPWWTTAPEISRPVEPGLPFKAAYLAGAGRAIGVVRERFAAFSSPALVLRGGDDIAGHEAHGTADLWRGAAPGSALTMISYPGHAHDVLFDGCGSTGLSMAAGENAVADDIVAWLRREQRLSS